MIMSFSILSKIFKQFLASFVIALTVLWKIMLPFVAFVLVF